MADSGIDTHEIILALMNNKNPELEDLIAAIKRPNIKIIHEVVNEFNNLRQFSDKPFSQNQLNQFVEISTVIFDVYVDYSEELLRTTEGEREDEDDKLREPNSCSQASQALSNANSPTMDAEQRPLWSDMNKLLNSLRTYCIEMPSGEKVFASERLRGHRLFTYHMFWRGVFEQAISELSLDPDDANSAFMTVNAEIVVYIHFMRAFGLVEEDVRLWLKYFISFSIKRHQEIKPSEISQFYEEVESVFSSADEEEAQLDLDVRNQIVRVLPNCNGYQCQYVDKERLKDLEFKEEPLFNCEQEQLLREITTMMSENVEPKKTNVQTCAKVALTRNQLIQKLWREQTDLPLFEEIVKEGCVGSLEQQIQEYIERYYHNNEQQGTDTSDCFWDREAGHDRFEDEENAFLESPVVRNGHTIDESTKINLSFRSTMI